MACRRSAQYYTSRTGVQIGLGLLWANEWVNGRHRDRAALPNDPLLTPEGLALNDASPHLNAGGGVGRGNVIGRAPHVAGHEVLDACQINKDAFVTRDRHPMTAGLTKFRV
jgi:hypothetical protein